MFILETITIVGLLTLLFWGTMKPSWKHATIFILTAASIFLIELQNFNDFAEAGIIILCSTFCWGLILPEENFVKLALKSLLTNLISMAGIWLIQIAWIPFYLYVMKLDLNYVAANEFWFGLPCRIVEYIILALIYIFAVRPAIGAKSIETLGKAFGKYNFSILWVYEPKSPWRDK
jgi:hypothetical protein